jgi:hypothetical protein
MRGPTILLIDTIISLVLGIFLITFPASLVEALGLPSTEQTFYPRMLGAVTIGISVALFVQWWKRPVRLAGLGVGGAIAIDLFAALFLAGWLLVGGPGLPVRGRILLWLVVLVLVGVSGVGMLTQWRRTTG